MKEWHLYKGATDDLGIVVSGATAEIQIPNAAKLIVTFAGTTVAILDKDGNVSLAGGMPYLNVTTLEVTGNINAICHDDAVICNNNEIVFN